MLFRSDALFLGNDDRKYVAQLSYPKVPDVCVIYQRYCVTTLIIHDHGDDAVYFIFIELTSSVPLAELVEENFHQSVEHGP